MDTENLVKTSFRSEDATVLLKDVTGRIEPLTELERELKIQGGVHYSELLPMEYEPTEDYLKLYQEALEQHCRKTAQAVICLAKQIEKKKDGEIVLVSLARAGTPIGVLVKRYLEKVYDIAVPHYSISIIRDRGIDDNAMKYILQKHRAESIQFLDGWVGKGTIAAELKRYARPYEGVDDELAVLADPAGITSLRGTAEDFLIPSSCLNSSVSGLFSRTILNDELISQHDFHGAVYYKDLEKTDRTYAFIDQIEAAMMDLEGSGISEMVCGISAGEEISNIAEAFGVSDVNLIKPGIGETTRVLMRRAPHIVLLRDLSDRSYTGHLMRLCEEKGVRVLEYPLVNYRACGIIKKMKDV